MQGIEDRAIRHFIAGTSGQCMPKDLFHALKIGDFRAHIRQMMLGSRHHVCASFDRRRFH
ncbi:hypothetical protein [Iodidimonas nitroreducens]|uniref:hypothetical protein n=1 Tax=Iodidimonas nitroreducens TaxID=1236968 RepID=UPI0028CFF872|nr:hypothetical protein [Iodidimonas nitroreducens]